MAPQVLSRRTPDNANVDPSCTGLVRVVAVGPVLDLLDRTRLSGLSPSPGLRSWVMSPYRSFPDLKSR